MVIRTKALQRAAELVGGRQALRGLLGVSLRELEAWLDGVEPAPTHVFLKAVDIIAAAPTRKSRAQMTCDAAIAAWAEARRAGPARPPPVLSFLQMTFEPRDGGAIVEAALGAAVAATGADMGTLQIRRPEGLVLVAHRGFELPFLEHFACVHEHGAACGVAARKGERVVVPDVQSSEIFVGTPSAAVMAEAEANACQSTPLVSPSGELVGMISTHYRKVRQPAPRELDVIDHIARHAAFWLDGGAL